MKSKKVFSLLGGDEQECEPGRDDLRFLFDKKLVVVEVKGVTGSAAEKHAAQLEKWVATSHQDVDDVKGVLVVNTWKDSPLDQRTEQDFPNQMLPYSKSRNHTLITGLELFTIVCDIEANPDRADFWREKILNTTGLLTDVPDWKKYIQQLPQEDSEQAE